MACLCLITVNNAVLFILYQQILSFVLIADLDKFATDDIMDPIAKAKMVALKGIKRVLAQDPMVVPPGINRYFLVNLLYISWTFFGFHFGQFG